MISLLAIIAISCGPSAERRYWHDRLYKVDWGLVSDSAIWVIAQDTDMVKQIEKSDSASQAIYAQRAKIWTADSLRRAHPDTNHIEAVLGGSH